MYQIKVKWNSNCDYFTYEFSTKAEAKAFQRAVEEMGKASGEGIAHTLVVPTTNIALTLISTVLVSIWTMIWWYLGNKYLPNVVMTYSYWQIGICSAFGYLAAITIAKLFDK